MKLYLIDADNIYFPQIRDYFREIISSYDNGNYRSAMVMLYSTIVCDLILKLKELSDVYSDETAEKILEEIEQKRKEANSSQWEWTLINKIKRQTEMLSDETYAIIEHIYSLRNFSAHPALTEDYELISPSPEMTVAYIKKALESIFTKPSVFAQNIVDRMSDDIASKKDVLGVNMKEFSLYLSKVYFERMSPKMMKQVFKAFWKFTFVKSEGTEFKDNRTINRMTLCVMLEQNYDELCEYIDQNKAYFTAASDNACLMNLYILLASYPKVYSVLESTVQYSIKTFDSEDAKLIGWFICGDIKKHLSTVKIKKDVLTSGLLNHLLLICKKQGQPQLFTKFIISYYGQSQTFISARTRFDNVVQPNLALFAGEDFVDLISSINSNYQIYNCFGQEYRNNQILEAALNKLPDTFRASDYENFTFSLVETDTDSNDLPVEDVDVELPF